MKSLRNQRIRLFILFVLPGTLLFILFFGIPFVKTFYYSMTDWNGLTKTYNNIGFNNFTKLIHDATLWKALRNNAVFCLLGGVLTFGIAIFNAVMITQGKLKESGFYRVVFYIPNIIATVIVSMMWKFVYNPTSGILNGLLNVLNLGDLTRNWLGNKATVVPCLIVVWVWAAVGFYMVMYISAIKGIPEELFEAADIDGANAWHKFTGITWPLILETTKTSLVFFIINAFSGCFTLVNVMTDGGPAKSSEVLTHYMYKTAFSQSKFGYATAIGVFVFAFILCLSCVVLILTRRKDAPEY